MDTRSHLHDDEALLCSLRSSGAALTAAVLRGIFDGFLTAIVVCAAWLALLYFRFDTVPGWPAYVVIFVLCAALFIYLRWKVWTHALFRVTTERILLQFPGGLFHAPLRTVKWTQYQECHTGHSSLERIEKSNQVGAPIAHPHIGRTPLDYLFNSRPVCIRFGTADGKEEICFPSLRYAQDLKHYLDKVDSAVRHGSVASVHPFVAKPRGKRDDSFPH